MLAAEEERTRGALLLAAAAAAAKLPPSERRYLEVIFSAADPLPPREIARLMGCDVDEVYRLKQWARRWLSTVATGLSNSSPVSVQG